MRRPLLAATLLLAGDVVVTLLLFGPAWAHPTTVTVGRRTDAPYTVWAFAWIARALTHGQSPLVSHALSAPHGVNLMTNATVAGLGILLAPITWVWGPLASFNVAATAALALTAWSAQVVLARTGRVSWPAAALGGLVAGFGPVSIAQEGGAHLHVTAAFLVPPILLGVGRLLSGTARHPARWGIALGVLAAAQLMIGEEVLAITAVVVAVAIAVVVIIRYPVPWIEAIQAFTTATTVFVLLATWPLWVQFAGLGHIRGPIQYGVNYPNDLAAFVTPTNHVSLTAGWVAKGLSSEGGIYLGIPLVLFAVAAAVRRWRDPLVKVVGVTGVVIALLSLGDQLTVAGRKTGVPMPWDMFGHLPVVESLIPVRFGVVLDFGAGALLALALETFGRRAVTRHGPRLGRHAPRTRPLVPVQAAIAVVCLLPLVPRLPFPTSRWDIPPFFRSPGKSGIPDGALIALGPYPAVSKPQAQMWLAVAGARWRSAGGAYFVPDAAGKVTIGGTAPASAVVETGLEAGIVPPRSERPTVVLQLIRDRVEAVVIGPVSHRDVVLRWWSQLLGPPRTEGGVAVFDVPTS